MRWRKSSIQIARGGLQRLSLAVKEIQLSLLFHSVDHLHNQHLCPPQPRILLIVIGGLGDSLLCETIFHHLKEERPERRVEVLTPGALPLFLHMPPVDTVIIAEPDKVFGRGYRLKKFRHFVEFLMKCGYEESVELLSMIPLRGLNSAFTGLLLWATGAPVRIGRKAVGKILWKDGWQAGKEVFSSVPHSRRIITHLFDPLDPCTRTKHESLISRRALGQDYEPLPECPQLGPVEGLAGIWAEELLKKFSEGGKYLVVGVNMEASYALKGWPEERFLTVMDRAIKEGLRFVIVGSQRPVLADHIKERMKEGALDLSGMTGLEELMALVSRCDLFFSVDSGPAHLAQAYKVPTLVLFGPSNDKEFGPVSSIHTALVAKRDCAGPSCVLGPCVVGRSCMLNITEEEVTEALLSMARKKRMGGYPYRNLPDNTHKEVIVFK